MEDNQLIMTVAGYEDSAIILPPTEEVAVRILNASDATVLFEFTLGEFRDMLNDWRSRREV